MTVSKQFSKRAFLSAVVASAAYLSAGASRADAVGYNCCGDATCQIVNRNLRCDSGPFGCEMIQGNSYHTCCVSACA